MTRKLTDYDRTRGSFGVIIILLAELVHALRGDDFGYKDDYDDEDPAGET